MRYVVYFVRRGDSGPIKIGTSSDVLSRIKAFRRPGEPVHLLGVVAGSRDVEHALHQKFSAHRIDDTEWFHPHDDILAFIKTETHLNVPPEKPQVLVRFDDELAEILDDHIERMQKREPGVMFSRADALRSLAMRGNEVEEKTEKRR